jgi:hypothetical protein
LRLRLIQGTRAKNDGKHLPPLHLSLRPESTCYGGSHGAHPLFAPLAWIGCLLAGAMFWIAVFRLLFYQVSLTTQNSLGKEEAPPRYPYLKQPSFWPARSQKAVGPGFQIRPGDGKLAWPGLHHSIIAGQLPQPPPPQLIGAGSLPPFAGEAIRESCFVRSALPHDGHVGVSDERTSVSNARPHLLQS